MSGKCEVYMSSVVIKQSTLVRHAFEVPLSRLGLEWHPLSAHSQVVEFKVTKWEILDSKTMEYERESVNMAGHFSFTLNAQNGALLTVLAGPLSESRIKAFCEACEEVNMKLTRQEMLALYLEYAQEAAQQMVRAVGWRCVSLLRILASLNFTI